MKDFEWNEDKRKNNLEKHRIDFIDAIEVFDDPNRIEGENSRGHEERYETIGTVNDIVLFLVYTYREKKRRIISARRASQYERKAYHETKKTTR